jgi:hypothetical protein
MMEIQHFTKPIVITLLIGPVVWYFVFWILYSYSIGELLSSLYTGAFYMVMASPFHWFVSIFTVIFALLPNFIVDFVKIRFYPIPNQIAAEIQKYSLALPQEPPPRSFDQPVTYPRFFSNAMNFICIFLFSYHKANRSN